MWLRRSHERARTFYRRPHALLDRLRELRHDASICTSRDTQRGVWLVLRILWRDGQIWTATILAEGKDETSALRVAVERAEQRARPGRVVPEKDASPCAQQDAD